MKNASNWLKQTIFQLHELLRQERRIGVEILELLWELERRKAYAELGFEGLFSFCVSELKFTEAQAFQRIQAMRALNAHPEIKAKLESGEMNVTTVAKVQIFLRQEKEAGNQRSKDEAKQLFQQIENKTVRQVAETLALVSGKEVIQKLVLELDEEAEELWKEVKNLSAHRSKGSELAAFKLMMRDWLDKKQSRNQKVDKIQNAENQSLQNTAQSTCIAKTSAKRIHVRSLAQTGTKTGTSAGFDGFRLGSIQVAVPQKRSRHIPVSVRQSVFDRDHHTCRNCGSKFAIQPDHIVAFAKNGSHAPENLRALCRNCNLYYGIKAFGLQAMRR